MRAHQWTVVVDVNAVLREGTISSRSAFGRFPPRFRQGGRRGTGLEMVKFLPALPVTQASGEGERSVTNGQRHGLRGHSQSRSLASAGSQIEHENAWRNDDRGNQHCSHKDAGVSGKNGIEPQFEAVPCAENE